MKTFPWLLLAALALAQATASQVDCPDSSECLVTPAPTTVEIPVTGGDSPVTPAPTTVEIPVTGGDSPVTPAPTTVEIPVTGGDSPVTPGPTTTVLPPYPTPNPATTSSDFTTTSPDSTTTSSDSTTTSSDSMTASPDSTTTSPDSTTTSLVVTATGAISSTTCNWICPKVYTPVCGSDSVTYANQCLLDYASCSTGAVVKIGDGKCTKRMMGESCVPQVCTSVEDPYCGSDGTTYLNMCMLENAQCLEPNLSKAHDGACSANTNFTCATRTCPKLTECRTDAGTGVAYCADICAAERCGAGQVCQLLKGDCFTAPCSAVATCVSADIEMF